MNVSQLTHFLNSLNTSTRSGQSGSGLAAPGDIRGQVGGQPALDSLLRPDSVLLTECLSLPTEALWPNCSSLSTCLSADDLVNILHAQTNKVSSVDGDGIRALAPAILYQFATKSCTAAARPLNLHRRQVPLYKSIGYGILFVTLVSLCSLGGAVIIPFLNKTFYKRMLTWMVGLAVGTLSGSGLLHLMPHTYGMTYESMGNNYDFLFKASAIFGGAYLFFVTERILKSISERGRDKKPSTSDLPSVEAPPFKAKGQLEVNDSSQTLGLTPGDQLSSVSTSTSSSNSHGHSHGLGMQDEEQTIATVAWMIIFGDGLHNFIDGLAVGSAFTESILAGISISVAVLCEEFPHELGDLAILLNSGMKFKQALFYNFLSACSCFIGLSVGIFLGDVTETGNKWIFAVATGMFLYLALTDMIPELNHQAEEMTKGGETPLWMVLLIQHSGVLTGFAIMLVMAIFGGNIDFT